jgi:signal transduction histidine kinase
MHDSMISVMADAPPPVEDGAHLLGRLLHRFRNSLTSVRGYAELLGGDEVSDERRQQWAAHIVTQLDRIEALQSRLDASVRNRRASGDHSLGMVLRAAMQRSRQRVGSHTDHVDLRLRGEDVLVKGDGDSLTEAVAAVFDNALEATAAAGGDRVDVLVARDGADWTLRVVDTGGGLTPEAAERAGTPFYSRKTGHLGLGLYLCRSILLRHDLDLELANAPGAGAVVTIRGRRLPSYQ